MKKLVILLLIIIMSMTMIACNKDTTYDDKPLLGEWTTQENQDITPEIQSIFDQAFDGYVGMHYDPIKLVATQVVSGINYKFLCSGYQIENPSAKSNYYVVIYKNLKNQCSILSINSVEEI